MSGGGGGKRFGKENQLIVFECQTTLKNPLHEEKTNEDLIDRLTSNYKTNIVAGASSAFLLLFHIEQTAEKTKLTKVYREKVDEHIDDPSIVRKINSFLLFSL